MQTRNSPPYHVDGAHEAAVVLRHNVAAQLNFKAKLESRPSQFSFKR